MKSTSSGATDLGIQTQKFILWVIEFVAVDQPEKLGPSRLRERRLG